MVALRNAVDSARERASSPASHLDGHRKLRLEHRQRAEFPGEAKVEEAPQLAEPVLDGRARHDDPVHRLQLLRADGDVRVRVPDLVALVQHIARGTGRRARVARVLVVVQCPPFEVVHAVAEHLAEARLVPARRRQRRRAHRGLVQDRGWPGPDAQLAAPLAQHRRRAHHGEPGAGRCVRTRSRRCRFSRDPSVADDGMELAVQLQSHSRFLVRRLAWRRARANASPRRTRSPPRRPEGIWGGGRAVRSGNRRRGSRGGSGPGAIIVRARRAARIFSSSWSSSSSSSSSRSTPSSSSSSSSSDSPPYSEPLQPRRPPLLPPCNAAGARELISAARGSAGAGATASRAGRRPDDPPRPRWASSPPRTAVAFEAFGAAQD